MVTSHDTPCVLILVTSSTDVYYGLIRSLAKADIPVVLVADRLNVPLAKSKYVRETIIVPSHKDEQAFVEGLIGLSDRYCGSLLMPPSDDGVSILSRNKDLLSRYFIVAVPDWDQVRLFLDKRYTYEIAEQLGVPHPKTRIPTSLDDVIEYAQNAMFPLVLKPRQVHLFMRHFSKKMFFVDTVDQLIEAYKSTEVVNYDVVLQEFIPGNDDQGANYNSYFINDQPVAEFTARKLRSAPPHTGAPRVVVSHQLPEIIASGRKIINGIGFNGFSCTEFKRDPRDGVYKLMEVNGRHNLSSLLAVECGINFPEIDYRYHIEGLVPDANQYASFEQNVYWVALWRDIKYTLSNWHDEGFTLMDYIRPYLLGKTILADFDLSDPGPFIGRLSRALRKVTRH